MEYHSGAGTKVKRQRVEQAIQLALQSKWPEAAAANRTIISMFPSDVDAFNRLGKALTEMGEYEDARHAYERALDLEPGNAIARKNIERIDALKSPEAPRAKASNLDPALFIAHTGKAGIASVNGVKGGLSALLTAGDILSIKAKRGKVIVGTAAGEVLGEVEPKIAVRLVRLMEGGNKYEAAVAGVPNGVLRIIIRETYQHPSQAGKVSFPASNGETVRPYVKERLVRYDLEEEPSADRDAGEDWDQDTVAGEGDMSLQDYQEAVEGEGSDDDEEPEE